MWQPRGVAWLGPKTSRSKAKNRAVGSGAVSQVISLSERGPKQLGQVKDQDDQNREPD